MSVGITERIKQQIAFELDRKGPPEGFDGFPMIPGGRYRDKNFQALEHKHLWKKSWVYACHADEIAKPGDYILWRNLGSPIIIVRGKDQQVRAFYNTCRHRGGPLVEKDEGHVEGFMCRYHGWSYRLNGELFNLRDQRDFANLDMACLSLVSVRCESWGNWIFLNEDQNAEPLMDYLQPIATEAAALRPDTLRLVSRKAYDVQCNVKVLLDAFLEVYHLKSIHQNTVDRFLNHRGTSITLWPRGHSRMVTPLRRDDWVDPGAAGMPLIPDVPEFIARNNVSYMVYPNLVFPPADSGIPFLTFWPKTDSTMVIECHWFAPDWGDGDPPAQWKTRVANFERILEEDTQFAKHIQESVQSDGFKGMQLNYQERRLYHWHEELDRRIGAENLPDDLKVTPTLSAFTER